jgi:hypothetical protein
MPDEKDGTNPAGNPYGQPLTPLPGVSTLEQRIMALEAETRAHAEEKKPEDLVSAVKQGEWWLIGINALLLIATVIIACIYYGQLKQMRIATKATQDAVDVAARTLSETERSNARQSALAEQARKDADIASDANRRGADAALQATIDNFRQDQRAWVAPLVPISKVENGKAFFNVPFKNTGRTPAVETQAGLKVTNNLNRIPTTDPEPDKGSGKGLIPPDGVENTSNINDPLDEAHTKLVIHGTHVYVFGTIRYKDIFGQKHWTQFCYETWGTMLAAIPCPVHNTTDDIQNNK